MADAPSNETASADPATPVEAAPTDAAASTVPSAIESKEVPAVSESRLVDLVATLTSLKVALETKQGQIERDVARLVRLRTKAEDAELRLNQHLKGVEGSAEAIKRIASTVQSLSASTQTDAAAISQTLATVQSAADAAKVLSTEITTASTSCAAAKTAVEQTQSVIATKSAHIEDAREHADKVRADLDRQLTTATQQASEAAGYKARTQSAADQAGSLANDTRALKSQVEGDALAIVQARRGAESSAVAMTTLADTSAQVEARVASYERHLESLVSQCTRQLETITSLLPMATSAGLAHAFDQRRRTFKGPLGRWQWIFVLSVLALVTLAGTGIYQVFQMAAAPTYDEVFRLLLTRLPMAGGLVWLAMHASREAALAKRLEEDYGYKAAIATSFEGFRKQMAEIQERVGVDSPLGSLCANTLAAIANPPGRIYDKHKLVVTPVSEISKVAGAATELVNAVKGA